MLRCFYSRNLPDHFPHVYADDGGRAFADVNASSFRAREVRRPRLLDAYADNARRERDDGREPKVRVHARGHAIQFWSLSSSWKKDDPGGSGCSSSPTRIPTSTQDA